MDYVAVNPDHGNDDGLQDIWREMNLAMECSMEEAAVVDPPLDGKGEDECDHSIIFRDDIGLVCCVCGFIKKSIETIIEFQWDQSMPMETVIDPPPPDGKGGDECDHSIIFRDDIGLVCCVCGFIQRSIETIIEFQWDQSMPMNRREREAGVVLSEEMQDNIPNGVYVGVEDDEENKEHSHANDDGLEDIWRETNLSMECSKEAVVDPPLDGKIEDECHHSFIFRDDIGHFCCVCGFIQRSIETIIEFQYVKTDGLEIP